MLRPPLKRRFVALQIQVRKEQRVIRHLPERVLVIGVRPLVCRTALDGLTQHRERSVVLALENGSEHGIRHGASHATSGRHREIPGGVKARARTWPSPTRSQRVANHHHGVDACGPTVSVALEASIAAMLFVAVPIRKAGNVLREMLCQRDRHRGAESRTGAPAFTGLSVISFTSTVDWVTSILMSSAVQIARFSETMAPRTKYFALPTSL